MVAEFQGAQHERPAAFLQAERNVQRIVNNQLFPHGSPNHAQFLTSSVSIGTGLDAGQGLDGKNQAELLRITLTDPHIETIPSQVREAVLASLGAIPVLKAHAKFEDDAKHAVELKQKLEQFIAKGAAIPKELLNWKGFDPQIAEKGRWDGVGDHAIEEVGVGPLGTSFRVKIPQSEAEKDLKPTLAEKVVENIRGRLPDIRAMLTKRIAKYKNISAEADLQKIKETVDKLDITVATDEASGSRDAAPSFVHVTIRSPEQKAESEKSAARPYLDPDLQPLKKTNILNDLTPTQLGKAMGRSFLGTGETAKDIFPLIAGHEDMKRAIGKALTLFARENPDQAKEVEAFLKDDAFKEHNQWNKPKSQRQELKRTPIVKKDPDKPGVMTIDITLPKGKVWEAVQQIAALDPAPTLATASTGQHFSQVNSMELVGVVGPDGKANTEAAKKAQTLIDAMLKTQAAVQQSMAQMASAISGGATLTKAEQTANQILAGLGMPPAPDAATGNAQEQAITPLAETLVQKVKQAGDALQNLPNVPDTVADPVREAYAAMHAATQVPPASIPIESSPLWVNRVQPREGTSAGRGAA